MSPGLKGSALIRSSGVATGVAKGGQSATPDSEKIAKNQEKLGKIQEKSGKKRKNREEKAKIGKFLSLCPSWQIGLATLLIRSNFQVFRSLMHLGSCLHIQIPPTGYVGLILRSTAVATVSLNTIEGTMEGTLQLLHA